MVRGRVKHIKAKKNFAAKIAKPRSKPKIPLLPKTTKRADERFENWPESQQIKFVTDVFEDRLSDEQLCIEYGYSPKSRHMLYKFKDTDTFKNLAAKIEKENIIRAKNRAYKFAQALMTKLIDIGLRGIGDAAMANVQRQAINDVLAKIGLHGKEGVEITDDREISVSWIDPESIREKAAEMANVADNGHDPEDG